MSKNVISFPSNRLRTTIIELFSRKTKGNTMNISINRMKRINRIYTHAANVYIFFSFEGITASNSAFNGITASKSLFSPCKSLTVVIFSRCFLITLSLAFTLLMRALAASISCIFLATVALIGPLYPFSKDFLLD